MKGSIVAPLAAVLVAGCSSSESKDTKREVLAADQQGLATAVAAPASQKEGTHCKPAEHVVYTCRFAREITVSVCEGNGELAYRYGPLGHPEIELVSDGGYGNVSFGWVRGQGDGFQKSLRFANGEYSYTVYSAVYGSLSDTPDRKTSGLIVTKGSDAVLSAKTCPSKGALQSPTNFTGKLIEDLPEDTDAAWF